MILTSRILLTIAAIQYGFMPLIADFSDSHVFHPEWPPHARFHLVWLLSSGAAFATYVIFSTWFLSKNKPDLLKHISLVGCVVLGAFFISALAYPLYGGSLSDDADPDMLFGIHANVFSFSIAIILQLTATALIWVGDEKNT